ncbi:uncharacterized protein KY384_006482 [Bacidia gigantensis]|uniref:uncharacterized protein n=1 Tax=Bacidia gigantensis TaxID=2732470 RepID=UPI001D05BD0A|nr:uncharacterized protein KY384_006482 [Bacidia gigantensis]KAG8528794.1 hypothetical protein KY384_006482 [Bacidia gigantensis]
MQMFQLKFPLPQKSALLERQQTNLEFENIQTVMSRIELHISSKESSFGRFGYKQQADWETVTIKAIHLNVESWLHLAPDLAALIQKALFILAVATSVNSSVMQTSRQSVQLFDRDDLISNTARTFSSDDFMYNPDPSFAVPIVQDRYNIKIEFSFAKPCYGLSTFHVGIIGTIQEHNVSEKWMIERVPPRPLSTADADVATSPRELKSRDTETVVRETRVTAHELGECGIGPPSATLVDSKYAFVMEGFWSPLTNTLCIDAFDGGRTQLVHHSFHPFDYNEGRAYSFSIEQEGYDVFVWFWFPSPTDVNKEFHVGIQVGNVALAFGFAKPEDVEWLFFVSLVERIVQRGEERKYDETWEIARQTVPRLIGASSSSGNKTTRVTSSTQRWSRQLLQRDDARVTSATNNANIASKEANDWPRDCGIIVPDPAIISSEIDVNLTGWWHPASYLCIDAWSLDEDKRQIGHFDTRRFYLDEKKLVLSNPDLDLSNQTQILVFFEIHCEQSVPCGYRGSYLRFGGSGWKEKV